MDTKTSGLFGESTAKDTACEVDEDTFFYGQFLCDMSFEETVDEPKRPSFVEDPNALPCST
jgi:hypothetical protein